MKSHTRQYVLAFIAVFVLLFCFTACNGASYLAVVDRWPAIKVPAELDYTPDESVFLMEFAQGSQSLAEVDKICTVANIELTQEQRAALARHATGNNALARKIVNRGQALRGAIERYTLLKWDNDADRMKTGKFSAKEIAMAIGERPKERSLPGAKVDVQKDDDTRTIVAEAKE